MQLGWIDFSKSERSKVLSVLDLLQEKGTLDELGIAPIRDGFANIFFPGTSTIQTRAKYFLIVPYALRDLEREEAMKPNQMRRKLDSVEKKCGQRFLAQNENERGIIGGVSLKRGRWVKRSPSEIYWSGLRQYRIFNFPNWTMAEYLRAVYGQKKRKSEMKELRSRQESENQTDWDDRDAGSVGSISFWNIPTHRKGWMDDLQMQLMPEEASFLKTQIMESHPDSMLGIILRKNLVQVLDCGNFEELADLIHLFPEQIQSDYQLALAFSRFLYIIRVVYNRIASKDRNERARQEYGLLHPVFAAEADVDLKAVFLRLGIAGNSSLCKFLYRAQACILADDYDGLCKCIRDREILLKGESRAKTAHPGEYNADAWFCGDYLDYRFPNARTIIRDIMEGEVAGNAES